MAKLNDEQLNAYLDGELSEREAREVERAIAADDTLPVRLDQFAKVDELLRGAVDRLEASAEPGVSAAQATKTNPYAGPKPLRSAANDNWWQLPLTASVAAMIGVFVGGTVLDLDGGGEAPIGLASYESTTELGGLLERAASGESLEIEGGSAKVQFTFIGLEGRPCREFAFTGAKSTMSGVACRGNDAVWNVEIAAVVQDAPTDDPSGYQTASAGGEAFGSAVSAMMQSEALSAEEEQALMGNNWTP